MTYINIFGVIIIALLMIPNIIWAVKHRGAQQSEGGNRLMGAVEQIGRYGCMISLSLNFWIFEAGFRSAESFVIWLFVTAALLLAYYVCWALYFAGKNTRMALAVIPSVIFVFSGIMMNNWPLLSFGLLFSAGHIYITLDRAQNLM